MSKDWTQWHQRESKCMHMLWHEVIKSIGVCETHSDNERVVWKDELEYFCGRFVEMHKFSLIKKVDILD